jgi:hypothetical protein
MFVTSMAGKPTSGGGAVMSNPRERPDVEHSTVERSSEAWRSIEFEPLDPPAVDDGAFPDAPMMMAPEPPLADGAPTAEGE